MFNGISLNLIIVVRDWPFCLSPASLEFAESAEKDDFTTEAQRAQRRQFFHKIGRCRFYETPRPAALIVGRGVLGVKLFIETMNMLRPRSGGAVFHWRPAAGGIPPKEKMNPSVLSVPLW
jgi:hypothetical protein